MRIVFTKTSLAHHALEVVRDDGSRESAILETKSLMPHDLIHYAFESEARRSMSFWGLVSCGHSFVELNAKDPMGGATVPRDELGETEMLVGALTGYLKGKAGPAAFLDVVSGMFAAFEKRPPAFLTEEFLAAFSERLRPLLGRWRAARKDEPMELRWPPIDLDHRKEGVRLG